MDHIETSKLIDACEDLNKVLALEPRIVVAFETKAKGAAKTAAEKKFKANLVAEIISVASGKDPETGVYDLQATDLPVLQPTTVELIYELCPEAKERLFVSIPPAMVSKEKTKKESSKKVIYLAWKEGQINIDILLGLVSSAVKQSTVKGWVQAWKNGKNLPAVAKVSG